MQPFAVWHEGIPEGQGRWVIALDTERERVLLVEEQDFYWKPLSECKFVKVATPDNPRPVVVVTPQAGIALPVNGGLNRAMRRGMMEA